MRIALKHATADDAAELARLHNAVADDLTLRFGKGHWSGQKTETGVLSAMRNGLVCVARRRGRTIATLALVTKKPWAIDTSHFTACNKPLYLLDMSVDPHLQRKGVGRACMEAAARIARTWPADAIRLDAYDAEAGAGPFYAKCGLQERGRVIYKGTPLTYFELML